MSVLFVDIAQVSTGILFNSFHTLKGLSGENCQGSNLVPIDRFSFKDVPLELLFNSFSAPECTEA